MASFVNKLRRMSYKGTDQHDEMVTHGGYAACAKNLTIENVGRKVKKSKKQITWHIGLCSDDYHIRLLDSIMSGRKQLFVNGEKIHDARISKKEKNWRFSFTISAFKLQVVLNGCKWEEFSCGTSAMSLS